jgi:lysine-specific demethylase/histidyl-hydroxylase NO66
VNKNKKRKGAPIVAGVTKVAKTSEAQKPPKIESVDAPTRPPKAPKAVTETVSKATEKPVASSSKSTKVVEASSSGSAIELTYVDRVEDAKPVRKSVAVTPEQLLHGPSTTGLDILEKPTLNVASKAKDFLKWFLWPLPVDEFFSAYYEKRVFLLKRHMPTYWDGWFSSAHLRALVDEGRLNYGTDVDVTMYKNGQRFTLNVASEEPAAPEVLWDLFQNSKCSVRVLRPQEYANNVSRMLALLEESFLSGFGSNAYYTPAGSQGFAPHWDDVEAFVLQLEGRKRWKIHGLGGDEEILPRFSSRNFHPEEVGATVMEVVLEPGDMLYFPRGTIHQAMSDDETDSFHLTVSCAQKNCWSDLMDIAVNAALIQASKTMPAFREGLPRDYGNYMGVMFSDMEKDEKRKAFLRTAMALCEAFSEKFLPQQIDDAADKMMCRFLYDRQPPQATLSSEEQGLSTTAIQEAQIYSSHANGASKKKSSQMDTDEPSEANEDASDEDAPPGLEAAQDDDEPITEDTKFRLVSKHCCRLVIEEEASLYYASENTTKYHEVDSMKIPMPLIYAESIEFLVQQYPKYVAVKELPLETEEERLDLVNELLDHQIAMVE